MIDKPSILARTMYGTRLYTHAIRERWPDETAMSIKGDDCGIVRNPLAEDGARTLHVWIEKTDPGQRLSDRIARHHDDAGFLPDGDCFDFAERLYGLTGQELLDHINSELHLHLEPDWNPYGGHLAKMFQTPESEPDPDPESVRPAVEGPRFSYFQAPIMNSRPLKAVTLLDVYNYLVSQAAAPQTAKLRTLTDRSKARDFKARHFDSVTFSGSFSYRDAAHLKEPSGLLCADLDHLPDVEATFQTLLSDRFFDTELLFRSPSGDGLKWVISLDYKGHSHEEIFAAVANYVRKSYGLRIDPACKDICRACFLPCDTRAYLNPKHLEQR